METTRTEMPADVKYVGGVFENQKVTKARNLGYDFITGFFILQMILLHVLQFAGEDLTRKPYSYLIYVFFYMPWYFYKSGTFFRERGVKETLAKDFRKLILPLFFFSLFGLCVEAAIRLAEGEFTLRWLILSNGMNFLRSGCIHANGALWFLTVLFLVKNLYNAIRSETVRWIAFAVSPLLAYVLHRFSVNWPLDLGACVLGFFYYACGVRMRNLQFRPSVFAAAVACYAVFCRMGISAIDVNRNALLSGDYILAFVNALAGIVVFCNLARFIRRPVPFFGTIGRDSMVFYAAHWPFLLVARYLVAACGITDPVAAVTLYVGVEAVALPCVYALNKRFGWV